MRLAVQRMHEIKFVRGKVYRHSSLLLKKPFNFIGPYNVATMARSLGPTQGIIVDFNYLFIYLFIIVFPTNPVSLTLEKTSVMEKRDYNIILIDKLKL